MNTLSELAGYIDTYQDRVLDNLNQESIDVYIFLSNRIGECDVSKDRVFQFVFRSFYRMDFAGLKDEFKTEYFRTLQGLRGAESVDLKGLAKKFYRFERLQGGNSLQFSFVTKLAHMVNVSYPIYDDEVANAFAFSRPATGDFESRLAQLLTFYERLRAAYTTIISDGLMSETIRAFHAKFPEQVHHLADVKILDFVFWSAGKLIRKMQLSACLTVCSRDCIGGVKIVQEPDGVRSPS